MRGRNTGTEFFLQLCLLLWGILPFPIFLLDIIVIMNLLQVDKRFSAIHSTMIFGRTKKQVGADGKKAGTIFFLGNSSYSDVLRPRCVL